MPSGCQDGWHASYRGRSEGVACQGRLRECEDIYIGETTIMENQMEKQMENEMETL